MKHFLIYTNRHKDEDLQMTERIRAYLEQKGQRVTLCIKETSWDFKAQEETVGLPEDLDCMLVLGGDGTVLDAARSTRSLHIPLIGVNLGTLGYMTQIEPAGLDAALDQLILGEYDQESRMMLNGVTTPAFGNAVQGWALNDIVIARSGSPQVMYFKIYVNGLFLKEYQADGVIITTPTGSTGYNLSAGGPIVEPGARLIMMTPICAHTLNQRSIILAPDDVIEIVIPEGKEGKVQCMEVCFDGISMTTLQTGDQIRIVRSPESVDFIQLNKISFLEILHKKMMEN